jgi:hypothetical protein
MSGPIKARGGQSSSRAWMVWMAIAVVSSVAFSYFILSGKYRGPGLPLGVLTGLALKAALDKKREKKHPHDDDRRGEQEGGLEDNHRA